ncbi:MAG: exosortase, partial [Gammaproteobacteria bacterium]
MQDLFHKWYAQDLTGPYSHGLLVACIVAYIVYKKIVQLRPGLSANPSYAGLIFLAGSVFVLFLSLISGVNFLQHIALLSALFFIIWFAYSFNIARQFILPVILLSLTFPIWDGAEYFLQVITIHTTSFLLDLTGVPFYRDGPFFHFASGVIEIAPECAGYQQMLVSMIIGLLFSYQHHLRIVDIIKTLFYLSVAAIVINTIRIIVIMVVGYYTKMESSLITKHLLLGWIIYGIGIFIFLYFYSG